MEEWHEQAWAWQDDNAGEWEEDEDEVRSLKPLEGVIVEIHGLEEQLWPQGREAASDPVDANGLKGRVRVWSEEQGLYIVRTFEGLFFGVSEENLRQYDPVEAELGGFDVVWPEHPDVYEAFAGMVYQDILEKGYCLIQMFHPDSIRTAASELASSREDYACLKRELEEGYLGQDAYSKVAWLEEDALEAEDALGECMWHLQELCGILALDAYEQLDFTPTEGVVGALLRMPIANTVEEVELDAGQVFQHDINDGKVEEYIDFIRRRRLCMMYFIDGKGGSIELEPVEGEGGTRQVPLSSGKVLVFRHDKMRYSYRSAGTDLVMQAWMATEPSSLVISGGLKGQTQHSVLDPVFGLEVGVKSPEGISDNVVSMACRFAASADDGDLDWTSIAAGTDTFTTVPSLRYDIDMYYSVDTVPGTTAVKHAGFRSTQAWMEFDHEYFGMSLENAKGVTPDHRVALETSFEALHRGGFTLETLKGKPIWTYVGDSGSDFAEFDQPVEHSNSAMVQCGARLMYLLGLTGTPLVVDTACSSSLVATGLCQQGLRQRRHEAGVETLPHEPRALMGLTVGVCAILGVSSFITLSGGGFLSPEGRCFTFDTSANGYARGEGVGVLFLKGSDDASEALERVACMVGSDVNQDGRSASMTAPNGPSQQQCILASLRMARLAPAEVGNAEMHGTGTALGDPIEVGAICTALSARAGQPLLQSSAKALTGHLEAAAGIKGLVKCILMALSSGGSPNCHLKTLNAHLNVAGFPTHFLTELCDTRDNAGIAGVSSFGYGGTNARADMWARCRRGPRKTADLELEADRLKFEALDLVTVPCPKCMGPMCWLCSAAVVPASEKHHCYAIREDFASYDLCSECYQGGYRHGSPGPGEDDPGEGVFITGTWCAWKEYEEMTRLPSGEYAAEVSLGEACRENFHLALNAAPWLTIHPVESDASPLSRIAGPESPHEGARGKHWLLDGRRDGVEAGTVYRVFFTWGQKRKSIRWEVTDVRRPVRVENEQRKRRYTVIGSWTAWKFRNMVADSEDLDSWRTTVTMGLSGVEEFHFARDQDTSQAIYPAEHRTLEPHIPVRGPDGRCDGKNWVVHGAVGETVTIRLRVAEGLITVSTHSLSRGERLWSSVTGREAVTYHIAGSWNGWALTRMVDESVDVHRAYVTIGEFAAEEFQLVVNRDWNQVLHPTSAGAAPGEGILAGPDADGEGLCWQIFGPPGQTLEITLDLRAEDRRYAVSSRRLAWNEHVPEPLAEEERTRQFDIVVYGATGFLGQLMVQHLDAVLSKGATRSARTWAIAGRDMARLSRVARGCRSGPGLVEARSPADVVRRCCVLVNAAGPCAAMGEPLIRACIEKGTDYIDASQEHQWLRLVIDKHHEAARRKRVAVVCSAGHVSAAYDVACLKLVERLGPLRRVRMYVSRFDEPSAGSIATKAATLERLTDRDLELEGDPFSLGGRRRCGICADDSPHMEFVDQDSLFPSLFLAPTGHDGCPERIIRRSCALLEEGEDRLDYGQDFQVVIREAMVEEQGAEALVEQRLPPPNSQVGREITAKRLRERAGFGGPSEELRGSLRVDCHAVAESEGGRLGHVHHASPGAHEASAIFCVTGALVLVEERRAELGGVLTPAAAFRGTTFAERVQAHSFGYSERRKLSFKYVDGLPQERDVREVAVQSLQSAASREGGPWRDTGPFGV